MHPRTSQSGNTAGSVRYVPSGHNIWGPALASYARERTGRHQRDIALFAAETPPWHLDSRPVQRPSASVGA